MVEVLISLPPSGKDMRDGLVILPSLGQTAGNNVTNPLGFVTFVYLFSIAWSASAVKLLSSVSFGFYVSPPTMRPHGVIRRV